MTGKGLRPIFLKKTGQLPRSGARHAVPPFGTVAALGHELDELRQMHQTMQQTASQFGRDMHNMATGVRNDITRPFYSTHEVEDIEDATWHRQHPVRPPPLASERKNWRLKRSALPHWYKARNGVRSKALSGAARVARYRPQKPLS